MKLPQAVAEARKFLVAVCGVAATALSIGLLHGTAEQIAISIVSLGTALGVWGVRNAKPLPPDRPVTTTLPLPPVMTTAALPMPPLPPPPTEQAPALPLSPLPPKGTP